MFRPNSRRLIVLFFVVALGLCLYSGTAEAQRSQMQSLKFQQDGLTRQFLLYQPARAAQIKGPKPLVLVIHGGAGTARGMVRITKRRWNALADKHGFYVAYPEGIDKMWDFGEGSVSRGLTQNVDDLAYFRTLIAMTSKRFSIDGDRIFATGISRGAQASFFLACNLPEQIRAVMPVATNLPKYMVNECRSGRAVGMALITGTADPQVPYDGGTITVLGQKRDQVLSSEETLKLWQRRNGCRATPKTKHIDKDPRDSVAVTVRQWPCSHAPVRHYAVLGGGHTWPSGRQFLPVRLVGRVSSDIDAAVEGWSFFSQF